MDEKKIILSNINPDDILLFLLNGLYTIGKIVCIYDDCETCIIILFFNNNYYKFLCKIINIKENIDKNIFINNFIKLCTDDNCYNNFLNSENSKKIPLDTNTKIIYIKCYNFDEFGRLLVELYDNEIFENSFIKKLNIIC